MKYRRKVVGEVDATPIYSGNPEFGMITGYRLWWAGLDMPIVVPPAVFERDYEPLPEAPRTERGTSLDMAVEQISKLIESEWDAEGISDEERELRTREFEATVARIVRRRAGLEAQREKGEANG